MRSARPARLRSRVATPSATPQRFQDFTKDFKISRRFQDYTKDFTKISRFHQRFQDFTKISRFQRRFQDFKGDFKISVEISAVVYEISASGGPLGSVCLSVCLFVCLFVYDYSRTKGFEAAYERYQQPQCDKGKKTNVAISLKRLRSRDMA